MPERFLLQFLTEEREWMTEAVCAADRFERLADGSYICSDFSSGVWIRCVAHHDGYFEHVDGGGEGKVHRYRLVELPIPDDADQDDPDMSPTPREAFRGIPRYLGG